MATSEEFVEVAHLDPLMVIAVNVMSGRLKVSSDDADTPEGPVAVIEDPLRGHRLYRYTGGIAGLAPAPVSAVSPAWRSLPVWGPPRLVYRRGRLVGIRLADARRIGIVADRAGRIDTVSWPGAHGEPFRSTIRYSGLETTITDAFGVSRTYIHNGNGDAYEEVPAQWRGPGYKHWVSPVLDSKAETLFIQDRTELTRPGKPDLLDSAQVAAGRAFGVIWAAARSNGGYVNVGVTRTAAVRHLDAVLADLGLLEIADVSTVFDTARSLNAAQYALERRVDPVFGHCGISDGQAVDDIEVNVTSTITAPETSVLDRALGSLRAWAVILQGGTSECATLATAATQ